VLHALDRHELARLDALGLEHLAEGALALAAEQLVLVHRGRRTGLLWWRRGARAGSRCLTRVEAGSGGGLSASGRGLRPGREGRGGGPLSSSHPHGAGTRAAVVVADGRKGLAPRARQSADSGSAVGEGGGGKGGGVRGGRGRGLVVVAATPAALLFREHGQPCRGSPSSAPASPRTGSASGGTPQRAGMHGRPACTARRGQRERTGPPKRHAVLPIFAARCAGRSLGGPVPPCRCGQVLAGELHPAVGGDGSTNLRGDGTRQTPRCAGRWGGDERRPCRAAATAHTGLSLPRRGPARCVAGAVRTGPLGRGALSRPASRARRRWAEV
jgi:hypothetical protein